MKPSPPVQLPPTARILVVLLADIGDVLLATPALRALRARYPAAQLDLLTPPVSAGVLRAMPELSNILVFDKFPFDTLRSLTDLGGYGRAGRFLRDLGRRHYDAVAIFHHYSLRFGALKFAALALATGAPVRVGVDNGRGLFLTHRVADAGFGAQHQAAYWLAVAALLGADPSPDGQGVHLSLNAGDGAIVTGLLADLGLSRLKGPLIAVHPGAGWYSLARRWPPGAFARLITALISQNGATVLLVGGPDEVALAEEVRSRVGAAQQGAVHVLAGRTTLDQTAALIARCTLFIGNDSGPLHLATAVGTPALGLFGLSNWRAFGPLGRDLAPPREWIVDGPQAEHLTHAISGAPRPARPAPLVVRRDLACQPCLYRGHSLGLRTGCGPRPCLTGLPPAAVLAAARWMLDAGVGRET